MEENKATPAATSSSQLKKEFVDDMPHEFKKQIGKSVATALTGFVAGVIVTTMVLYPWLYFLGKLCPSKSVPTGVSEPVQGGTAPAPANP